MEATITKLGLLGGTFDPPHIGHIRVAEQARSALGLDEVWLVVANQPWQKVGSRVLTSAGHRLAMVIAAVEGIEGVRASSIELDRGGDSYTIDTLEELKAQNPRVELFLIVGADAAGGIQTWHRFDDLANDADLVIVNRQGTTNHLGSSEWPGRWRNGSGVHQIEIQPIDVSSTELREHLSAGSARTGSIRESVLTYIAEHRLYDESIS